jgi:putative transcriptional regulator
MSLEGQFLVASRELLDPNFVRTVVLLVRHTDEGAMGLVINRPTKTTVAEAWRQVSEAPCPTDALIHLGGPCRGPLMAVHADAALGEIELVSGTYFCADPENIEQLITKGEDPTRYFVGFAGWGPGQLEAEMREDSWLKVAAVAEQIFAPPQDLWNLLIRQIAGLKVLSMLHIKHVPANPSLN